MQKPEEALLVLCNRLGLKASHSVSFPNLAYVNGHITYVGGTEDSRISNLAHDIAHWLVASPTRRKMPDFGLGTSPDSMGDAKLRVRFYNAQKEEGLASVCGMALEEWAGHDPEWTWNYHNWDGEEQVQKHMETLCRRRLLQRHKTKEKSLFRRYRFDPEAVV